MNEKMVIADICHYLRQLGSAGILHDPAREACLQGAELLSRLRELILEPNERGNLDPLPSPEGDILARLRWVLVQQGEG